MTMRVHAKPSLATDSTTHYRHICGWCRRDLGALWQGSQQHSYGICDTCKQIYFAYLYEPATHTTAELEKARA
jgi:hypothetical protein